VLHRVNSSSGYIQMLSVTSGYSILTIESVVTSWLRDRTDNLVYMCVKCTSTSE